MKKHFHRILCLLLAFCLSASLLFSQAVNADAYTVPVVVLDAGHGGIDSGCSHVWNGKRVNEKDLNLSIAKACKAYLETNYRVSVRLTRSDDTYLTLEQRVNLGATYHPALLVSMHVDDSNSSSVHGCSVLISNGNYRSDIGVQTRKLGTEIIKQLTSRTNLSSFGSGLVVRSSENKTLYPDGSLADYYGIVRRSVLHGFPGVIIEHGFLSSWSDYRNSLSSTDKLADLGTADAIAIANYLGLKTRTAACTDSSLPFSDVFTDDWYYPGVKWAYTSHVTGGTGANTFSPEWDCTRAQIVTLLWNFYGKPDVDSDAATHFTDVSADSYYYHAVLWAEQCGIASGTSDTTFSPDMVCTRGQIVTLLWNIFHQPTPECDSVPFVDIESEAYYHNAVLWAFQENITTGTSDTTFSPEMTCNRAQIVTFLFNAKDLLSAAVITPIDPDSTPQPDTPEQESPALESEQILPRGMALSDQPAVLGFDAVPSSEDEVNPTSIGGTNVPMEY